MTEFGWNQVNIEKIITDKVMFFIGLALARSRRIWLNALPSGLMLKQLLWDLANVNALNKDAWPLFYTLFECICFMNASSEIVLS